MRNLEHKCKRLAPGEYEYRGFAVYVNLGMKPGYSGRWHVGLGTSVHSEASRQGCMCWIDNCLAGVGDCDVAFIGKCR